MLAAALAPAPVPASTLTRQPFWVQLYFVGTRNTCVGGTCSSELIWKRASEAHYIFPRGLLLHAFWGQVHLLALLRAPSLCKHFLPTCFQMPGKATAGLPSEEKC